MSLFSGRDGNFAHCLLLYRVTDISSCSVMAFSSQTDLDGTIYAMVKYCQSLLTCRRVLMSQFFHEPFDAVDCNFHCDNCLRNRGLKSSSASPHLIPPLNAQVEAMSASFFPAITRDFTSSAKVLLNYLMDLSESVINF